MNKLTENFKLPGHLRHSGKKTKTIVQFRIQRDGRITHIKVIQGSGSPILDGYARQAVQESFRFLSFENYSKLPYITASVPFEFGNQPNSVSE